MIIHRAEFPEVFCALFQACSFALLQEWRVYKAEGPRCGPSYCYTLLIGIVNTIKPKSQTPNSGIDQVWRCYWAGSGLKQP